MAPSCTAKKMPGRPCIQKKSAKVMCAAVASIILGESPIIVATPCRLDAVATAISTGTGDTLTRLAVSKASGAAINTAATFSIKAESAPAKATMARRATGALPAAFTIFVARKAGACDSTNSSARIMVPKKMPSTFQLRACQASRAVITPNTRSTRLPTHT